MLIITIAMIRVVLVLVIFSYALYLMSKLQRDQNRRRTNVYIRYAIALCASGGLGVILLLVRRLLVWLYSSDYVAWRLLYNSPDRLGWMIYSLCECLILLSTVLFMIGIRKMIYRSQNIY